MKKIIIILITFAVLAFILSFSVFAETDEQYSRGYELIGGDRLEESLNDSTKDFLSKNGIDAADYNWVNRLSDKGFLQSIWDLAKKGFKTPFRDGIAILSVILITAAFTCIGAENGIFKTAMVIVGITVSLTVSKDIWTCISSSVSAVRYLGEFMMSFIPVFIIAVSLSGKVVSASVSSGMLMVLSQCISAAASYFILPVMGGYMSFNVISAIADFPMIKSLSETVKKVAFWTLSLISTLFVGILGIQTSVNSATDTLTLKTAKFIVGTCVPVAGGTIAEAANTVYASFGLLKSSVGIYGVFIVGIILLPVIIESVLWKGVLGILSGIALSFSQNGVSKFLESVNSMLSVLVTVLLFTAGLFIISLSILVTAGKT